MIITRKSLAVALSRPGIRLRRLPVLSRIAVCFLAVVVLLALFAPSSPRTTRSTSSRGPTAAGIPPQATGWGRTASAGTSSAG